MKNTNKYKFTNTLIIILVFLNISISSAFDNFIIDNNEIIELNQKYKHLNNINISNLYTEKNFTFLDSIKFGNIPQIFYYNNNHQLDSAVIPYQTKYVTKFDQNNNLILEEYYENWGLGDTVVLWAGTDYKYEYSYDEKNRLYKRTAYYPVNEYLPIFKVNWEPLNQDKYIYEDSSNRIKSYYQKWNFDLNDTIYETGYFYEYFPNQNIIYRKLWNYKTNKYDDLNYKYVQDLNHNNNIILKSNYKYDENVGWILVDSYANYIYDDKDNLITELRTYIDGSTIKNVSKTNFIYNENNQIESKVYQIYSTFYEDWVNETKNLYIYDEKGNITQEITQKWNIGWKRWIDDTKTVTIIDNNIDLENLRSSPKIDKKILKISRFKNFSVDNPKWELQNESNYHYSQKLVSSIEDFNEQDLTIYPNPAKDFLNLGTHKNKSFNLIIFDLNGNIVLELNDFVDELLDISKLNKGTYFLLIEGIEIQKSIKFIKSE